MGVNLLRGGLWWLLAKETGQGDAKGWDGDQGREYGNVEWGEGRRRVLCEVSKNLILFIQAKVLNVSM